MPHMPGMMPILIIGLVLLLLFGPSRLPEAARAIGRSSKEFKKGLQEDPDADRPALHGDSEHTPH